MKKREWILIVTAFVVIFLLALWRDIDREGLKDGVLLRGEVGDREKEVTLYLEAGEVLTEQEYSITLAPRKVSQQEAAAYFQKVKETIEEDFVNREGILPIQDIYEEGRVEASWSFQPYGYIQKDGTVLQEKVPNEGIPIEAEVVLTCGEYEEAYVFSFLLERQMRSKEEQLLAEIDRALTEEMKKEGVSEVKLPREIGGISLNWREQPDYLSIKIFLLEILALIAIVFGNKKMEEQNQKKRKQKMEEEYPDIVNQLTVLLGAGMTLYQAWCGIARQYEEKRGKGLMTFKEVYEEIQAMCRSIQEGERERIAYKQFLEKVDILCYRRLMGILLNNLDKGTADLSTMLESECKQAYDQRIRDAKAKGEEASTKLLLPLMIMMLVVMVVVLLPAIIRFT